MSKQPFLSLAPLVALVAALPLWLACPSSDDDPDDGCVHQGVTRSVGESFPAGDGCNSCSCLANGEVACTLIACQPGGAGGNPGTGGTGGSNPGTGCEYAGKVYPVGKSFPSSDGCNTCSCTAGGSVVCTERACLPQGKCTRAGCSGQLCVEASAAPDVITDCAERPEYACYRNAACERQPDGQCGFTPSETLKQCLAETMGPTCSYGGKTYAAGASFPAIDGCNTCICGDTGAVACTKKACPQPVCDFRNKYEYGDIGGFRLYEERSYLAPGASYRHQRNPLRSDVPSIGCTPAMPACGTPSMVTAADVEAALAHQDVQHALSLTRPPLFGRDTRPVDGTVFELVRGDGRGFLVGFDCPATFSSCQAIPPGIKALRDLLVALDRQQLAKDECKKAGF